MTECDGCREFVRLQKELCDLLDESDEGDSLVLHDRCIYAIKALKERLDAPQAPIARVHVLNDQITGAKMYAPGLPDGEHDLYCEPVQPSGDA